MRCFWNLNHKAIFSQSLLTSILLHKESRWNPSFKFICVSPSFINFMWCVMCLLISVNNQWSPDTNLSNTAMVFATRLPLTYQSELGSCEVNIYRPSFRHYIIKNAFIKYLYMHNYHKLSQTNLIAFIAWCLITGSFWSLH